MIHGCDSKEGSKIKMKQGSRDYHGPYHGRDGTLNKSHASDISSVCVCDVRGDHGLDHARDPSPGRVMFFNFKNKIPEAYYML